MKTEDQKIYCFCRKTYNGNFMIECDGCKEWFHGNCIGLNEQEAHNIEIYYCLSCQKKHGFPRMKDNVHYTPKAGSPEFIELLKSKTFLNGEHILRKMVGRNITPAYFRENGFNNPILVARKENLGIKLPPSDFDINELMLYIDKEKMIDVIDVHNQVEIKMRLKDWLKYYTNPFREKIYNVISLEITETELGKKIKVPRIVRKLSWVELYWPKPDKGGGGTFHQNNMTNKSNNHADHLPKNSSSPKKGPLPVSQAPLPLSLPISIPKMDLDISINNNNSNHQSETTMMDCNNNNNNNAINNVNNNNIKKSYKPSLATVALTDVNHDFTRALLTPQEIKMKERLMRCSGTTMSTILLPYVPPIMSAVAATTKISSKSSMVPPNNPTVTTSAATLTTTPSYQQSQQAIYLTNLLNNYNNPNNNNNSSSNLRTTTPAIITSSSSEAIVTTTSSSIPSTDHVKQPPKINVSKKQRYMNTSHLCDKSLTPNRFVSQITKGDSSHSMFDPSFYKKLSGNTDHQLKTISTLPTTSPNYFSSYLTDNNYIDEDGDKSYPTTTAITTTKINNNSQNSNKAQQQQHQLMMNEEYLLPPCVEKYCLMSVKDSYTDYHIDFGGSSVWYHVVRGKKIFYLIPPTPKNLKSYENWSQLNDQTVVHFHNMVDEIYACEITQGQTIFLPSGWIHAVYTPMDSLVFGGNFLHSYSVSLQMSIYELETRLKTAYRFMFPYFDVLCWLAAEKITRKLNEFTDTECPSPPSYLVKALISLNHNLTLWEKSEIKFVLPNFIHPPTILKGMRSTLQNIKLVYDSFSTIDDKFSSENINFILKEEQVIDDLERVTQTKVTTSSSLPVDDDDEDKDFNILKEEQVIDDLERDTQMKVTTSSSLPIDDDVDKDFNILKEEQVIDDLERDTQMNVTTSSLLPIDDDDEDKDFNILKKEQIIDDLERVTQMKVTTSSSLPVDDKDDDKQTTEVVVVVNNKKFDVKSPPWLVGSTDGNDKCCICSRKDGNNCSTMSVPALNDFSNCTNVINVDNNNKVENLGFHDDLNNDIDDSQASHHQYDLFRTPIKKLKIKKVLIVTDNENIDESLKDHEKFSYVVDGL